MQPNEALQYAEQILVDLKAPFIPDITKNFKDYAEHVGTVVRSFSRYHKEKRPWLKEWALAFRKVYDDFDRIIKSDPMLAYRPRNKSALEFHSSPAFIRYFRAGNRTSKTTSGYAEHYFTVTGYHPYRTMRSTPASTFIICGLPFTDYAPKVFEKKFLYGEDDNPLSPMFPEGGKWFYHYASREHIITLACPDCANKGQAGNCPGHHAKVTIALVSSEKGVGVIEAFKARLGHADEHIPEEFFNAMKMRVADDADGNLIITGTPLHGLEAWENRVVANMAKTNSEIVSLHTCTQYDGNILTKAKIDQSMVGMDEFEIRSRIYGEPAPQARNPVFDRTILAEMLKECYTPDLGVLASPVNLIDVDDTTRMEFTHTRDGALRVWKQPEFGGQYIIAVDTAAGLTRGDASCASVLKLDRTTSGQITLEMVAQWHGWTTVIAYADEVFKLAIWYNSGLVIIELTGGYGRAVLDRLRAGADGCGLNYWNIFRDISKAEMAEFHQGPRYGVDTTGYSKASMVAALQHFIKGKLMKVYCVDTIREMTSFDQERTDFGTIRFRGAKGSPDDRAMSLVIGASVAASYPVFDVTEQQIKATETISGNYKGVWKEIHNEIKVNEADYV